jgi:SAM-dependent methyltransferase
MCRRGQASTLKRARKSVQALKRTRFECRDVIESPWQGRFDTIMCLSVTKWVHFNWGDDGVKRLFKQVYNALYPEGIFVLEPQPWRSYRKVFKKPVCDFPSHCQLKAKFDRVAIDCSAFRRRQLHLQYTTCFELLSWEAIYLCFAVGVCAGYVSGNFTLSCAEHAARLILLMLFISFTSFVCLVS